MIHLFIDTNVVLDFLTDRKPFSFPAAVLFDLAIAGEVTAHISAVSYSNIYYLVRKVSSHSEAIRILRSLQELTGTADTTTNIIDHALNSGFKDFEDGIQYFSAKSIAGISGIVTRNTIDFKKSELPIWSPEEAIQFVRNKQIS
jgi:predicted nucleic acid-binding protein